MSYDIHGPWERNAELNSPLLAREDEIEDDRQKNVVGIYFFNPSPPGTESD